METVSKFAGVAVLVVGAGLVAAAPAEAASAALVRTQNPAVTNVAAVTKEPETTGSTEKAPELAPNCAQSRKRLWVESEGWIVRRVTTCY